MTKQEGRLSLKGLDENVVESFRKLVRERYGKLHTVFGQEVQKAMVAYLDDNYTHTHTHKNQSERKINASDRKIKLVEEHIQDAGLMNAINNGGSVRPNAIKSVLRKSVGIDPRTVNNYYNAFCQKHELITNPNGELTRL